VQSQQENLGDLSHSSRSSSSGSLRTEASFGSR
jgi:hypothetical protein